LLADAIEAFAAAVRIDPAHAEATSNLGCALSESDRLDDAITVFQSALEKKPDAPATYNNLGNARRQAGQLDEAIGCYRKALELRPGYAVAHSNLLYALHAHPDCNEADLLAEHRRWNEVHAESLLPKHIDFYNAPAKNRRLRIGYVSPDFRRHPVGSFSCRSFRHDSAQFEGVLLFRRRRSGRRKKSAYASAWRHRGVADGRSPPWFADRIDILVDLTCTQRTQAARLCAKRRPSSDVFGYCNTGLETMDYRITDPYLTRQEQGQNHSDSRFGCAGPVVLPAVLSVSAAESTH
jgi:predicted O-linked N-acetylglucosamine transferase (SPINDLY family)